MSKVLSWLNRHKLIVVMSIFLIGLIAFAYALYWQSLPQGAIGFLPVMPSLKPADKILIFSPHPDDETIGAGGLIYQAKASGTDVWVALVTDGNKHGLETKRYAEFNATLDQLGVKASHRLFLNYPDGGLKKQDATMLEIKLAAVVHQVSPTIILGPAKEDEHPDHKVTGRLVYDVATKARIPFYGYLTHYNRFPSPQRFSPEDYLMPPIKLLSRGMWYKYPITSSTQDIKLEALLQYKTQLKNPFLRKMFYGSVRKNELFVKY